MPSPLQGRNHGSVVGAGVSGLVSAREGHGHGAERQQRALAIQPEDRRQRSSWCRRCRRAHSGVSASTCLGIAYGLLRLPSSDSIPALSKERKGRFPGNYSHRDFTFRFFLEKQGVTGYAWLVAIGSALVETPAAAGTRVTASTSGTSGTSVMRSGS